MKKVFAFLYGSIYYFISISLVLVALYAVLPPLVTPYQIIRVFSGSGISKDWESWDNISKYAFRAVVAAEDARFMRHNGFEFKAIKNAMRYNARKGGTKIRGGSTISMQTAKNTFLPHSRNYIRKALEAYFTVLIENIWGKKRILEMYINVIEFGDGIYGIEAASQHYFNKSASKLSRNEAAALAAILPLPRTYNPVNPSPYVKRRINFVLGRIGGVQIPK